MRLKLTKQFDKVAYLKRYIGLICIILAIILLYTINIHSLPPAGNSSEQAVILSVNSGMHIINDISFAPQKIADYLLFKLGGGSTVGFRTISVLFTIFAVVTFSILIKHWISTRVAIMAGLLFATSSWVLFDARSAEFDAILLFGLPAILLAGTLLKIKEYDPFLPLTTFLTALTLYIPGFWIFILTGALILRSDIYEAWQIATAKAKLLLLGAFLLPLTPLFYALAQGRNFLEWLGFFKGISLKEFTLNLINVPSQMFIGGVDNPEEWVYGTPIIDAITTALIILGVSYVVIDKRFPTRRNVLIVFAVASLVLIGLAGPVYISLLLPLLYIFTAFGIAFLLEQWFHIFPLNPMARGVGIVIVSIMLLAVTFYHTSRYYYVWPRSHAASEIFKQ